MGNSQSSSSSSGSTSRGGHASQSRNAAATSSNSTSGYPGHTSSSSSARRSNNPVASFLSSSSSPSTASSSSGSRRHHSHHHHSNTQSSSSRRNASRRVQHQHQPTPPPPPPIDKSEIVDAGHVAPINELYHATHHYDPYLVRDLIRARRIAPFYTGLEDVDEDEVRGVAQALDLADEAEDNLPLLSSPATPTPATTSAPAPSSSASSSSAATAAVTSTKDDNANDKAKEQDRVKQWMAKVGGAVECPICFLYYPSNINKSNCCDQPICTECFVQIKRPDARTDAACPFCTRPAFAVVYTRPSTVTPPTAVSPTSPKGPMATLPTPPESSSQLIEPWPTMAQPMAIPSAASSDPSRRTSESDAAQEPGAAAAVSPPSLASLTITSTTHTRTVRSQSTSALAATTAPDDVASPGTSAPTPSATADHMHPSPTPTSSTPTPIATRAPAPQPVSSDDLRPAYVRQLQQEHQMAVLREHQDAAAARVRRMLHESTGDPGSSAAAVPALGRRGSRDGSAAAAAILASAMGLSRRQVERVYMRALGADLEELMVMEAMRASLAEEEERQRRAEEEAAGAAEAAAGQAAQGQGGQDTVGQDQDAGPVVVSADDDTPIALLSEKHGVAVSAASAVPGVPANVVVPVMEGAAVGMAGSSSSAAAEAQASLS